LLGDTFRSIPQTRVGAMSVESMSCSDALAIERQWSLNSPKRASHEVLGVNVGGCVQCRPNAKAVEIRGAKCSLRPELDGVYRPLQDLWAGAPVFRNGRTNVHLIWSPRSQRWCAVPSRSSKQILAYANSVHHNGVPGTGNVCPLPCQVPGPWIVNDTSTEPQEQAEPAVECVFKGQTVVVSGRSGHNERLNGIFSEMLEDYGGFPAFVDRQKHLFIYRRIGRPMWVISNRLGPAIRNGRGVIFAEAEGDVPEPYLVQGPWVVGAWGSRSREEDPHITVFLRAADSGVDAPAPPLLAVRSRIDVELAGEFALVEGALANGHVFYRRAATAELPERFLFWEGECWCIGRSPELRRRDCDAASQRRDIIGRNHPDDAVWCSVEVLRGGGSKGSVEASLLASLRGRTSMLAKQFA